MATVFMKWLETNPKDYDRGIQLLTLGRIQLVRQKIAREYVHEGMQVLEIGCGTGTLCMLMAKQDAIVTGIDASPAMLGEAQKKITICDCGERITLKFMDAAQIGDHFPPASFDLIVSTLVFSEMPPDEQRYVLDACYKLLAPGGRMVIADEIIPSGFLARLMYYVVRLPLVLLTWLLTRTTTQALHEFDAILAQNGFRSSIEATYLGNSLVLYTATHAGETLPATELPLLVVGRLRHRVTFRTVLIDVWALFFRLLPPYPKVRTGLYTVGHPTPDSPVLVTGNFDLTVRRLVRAIDRRVDVWVLVADSAGINVWCAAGGGYFTAEKVIAAVKSSHLSEVVNHHALILPQLCANGVDGWKIRKETGWGVHWGPVRAQDIPSYLAGKRKKTDAMRWVRFPLKDRLEMMTASLVWYAFLFLLPAFFFWRQSFWQITATVFALSYFYAVALPWIPGRDGLYKSIPLTLITLAGFFIFTAIWPLPVQRLFNWAIGLTGLSVFTAAELQGMTPLMRGEQSNWKWEALMGAILGLIYWLAPLGLGWR